MALFWCSFCEGIRLSVNTPTEKILRSAVCGLLLGGLCGSYTTRLALNFGGRYFIEPAALTFVAIALVLYGLAPLRRLLAAGLRPWGLVVAITLLLPLPSSMMNGVPLTAALADLRALMLFIGCFYIGWLTRARISLLIAFMSGLVIANMLGTAAMLLITGGDSDLVSFEKLRVPALAYGILIYVLVWRGYVFSALAIFIGGMFLAFLSNYRVAVGLMLLSMLLGFGIGILRSLRRGHLKRMVLMLAGITVVMWLAYIGRFRIEDHLTENDLKYSQLVRKTEDLLAGDLQNEGSVIERWRDVRSIAHSFPQCLLPSGYGSRYFWTNNKNPTGMGGNTIDSIFTYGLVHFGAIACLVWCALFAGVLLPLYRLEGGAIFSAGVALVLLGYGLSTAESILIPELAVVNGAVLGLFLTPQTFQLLNVETAHRKTRSTYTSYQHQRAAKLSQARGVNA